MSNYRIVALLIGFLSALGVGLIVFRYSPSVENFRIKLLFFTSLFFMLWGLTTFIFSFFPGQTFIKSFRRGSIFAISTMIVVGLSRFSDISAIGVGTVFVFALGIELLLNYLSSRKKYFDDFS